MNVLNDIADERRRQIEVEGWSSTHDDEEHKDGTLASAAACYASPHYHQTVSSGYHPAPEGIPPIGWPYSLKWWKPKNRRRDLIRAGALIVAEIERLDRQVPRHMSNEAPEMREQTWAADLVRRWEHGDEAHRQWLRDVATPDIAAALTTAREQGRAEALADVTDAEVSQGVIDYQAPYAGKLSVYWLSVACVLSRFLASRRRPVAAAGDEEWDRSG